MIKVRLKRPDFSVTQHTVWQTLYLKTASPECHPFYFCFVHLQDGWTKIFRNLQQNFMNKRLQLMQTGKRDALSQVHWMMRLADMQQMNEVLRSSSLPSTTRP
jgi:hypothetical protein